MQEVPDPLRFLTGVGATTLSYEEAVELIETILGAFGEPGERITIEQLSRLATTGDLCQEVSAETVLLFAFGGRTQVHHLESHIVCGVATNEDQSLLHIACSAAFSSLHLRDGDYVEQFHPSVGRYSNDAIAVDGPVQIAPNWRWRLTLARAAEGAVSAQA